MAEPEKVITDEEAQALVDFIDAYSKLQEGWTKVFEDQSPPQKEKP